MVKDAKRLRRQFDALGRGIPATRGPIAWLLAPGMRLYRVPLGFMFLFGGFLSILPVFGIWMLPLGLMLLAVDIPLLRPVVSTSMIRVRRRIAHLAHQTAARPPRRAVRRGRTGAAGPIIYINHRDSKNRRVNPSETKVNAPTPPDRRSSCE